MGCDSETLTNLVNTLSCSKPAYCPPCVSTLETALEALIDALDVRVDAIENGGSHSMLASWLFNS